jgi:hypothetical protein
MKSLSLSNHVDGFLEEWMKTIVDVEQAVERKDFKSVALDTVQLPGLKNGNYVNRVGFDHLNSAATLLLERDRLDLRLTTKTARQALIDAFGKHKPKAIEKGVFSDTAIINGASARLKSVERHDGAYVFTARLAPLAKKSDFRVGPVRILSKRPFLREYAVTLRRAWPGSEDFHRYILKKWISHLKEHDHLILVDMVGFEREMGWKMARECAEYVLNLVRMLFGYSRTDRIRLGGDFTVEHNRSSLIVQPDGNTLLSTGTSGMASVLEDNWVEFFDRQLCQFNWTLASYGFWLASGTHSGNPVTERLRYANALIAEAYCEPSDRIRLVRLVSALEALALLDGQDKAHNLASRCANAGGWSDPQKAVQIFDDVKEAYRWRNAVVHGDAPHMDDVKKAFFRLERHLLDIFLGFIVLFAEISNEVNPQSVRRLRRELKQRVDIFFWGLV